MAATSFRLPDQTTAAIKRLAHERELTQTGVVVEAVERFLAHHERERSDHLYQAQTAMGYIRVLEKKLGGRFPEGPRTWTMRHDDVHVRAGDVEFWYDDSAGVWRALRVSRDDVEQGVVEDGAIRWTEKVRAE